MRRIGGLILVSSLWACSREPQNVMIPAKPSVEALVLRVDGMIKAEGGKT
jgi:hypothetical protein